MNLPFILSVAVCFLPGLWLALKKNFLRIPNRKLDIFPVRLFFVTPYIVTVFMASLVTDVFAETLCPELYRMMRVQLGAYASFPIYAAVNMIFVFWMHSFVLRKDLPPEKDPDFMNYDLYVYWPLSRLRGGDISKLNCLDMDAVSGGDFFMGLKAGEHFTEKEVIKRLDIGLTNRGEMIASPRAVDLFSMLSLSGCEASPITVKGLGGDENFYGPFYRIRSLHKMPHMASPTIVKVQPFLSKEVWIADDLIYYAPEAIADADDFNESFESVEGGTYPYWRQSFPIVSNRVMKLFIDEFGQNRSDFIPVHCDTEAGTKTASVSKRPKTV